MAEVPAGSPIDPLDTPEALGFKSDEQIFNQFEDTDIFKNLPGDQISAKLEWILLRRKAAFVIYAAELGLNLLTIRRLFYMQCRLDQIVDDFVTTGLELESRSPDAAHPLYETLDDLLVEVADVGLGQVENDRVDRVYSITSADNDELFAGLEKLRGAAQELDTED